MAELDDEKLREAIGSRLACPVWPECGDDEGRCLACAEAEAIIAALKDRDRLRAALIHLRDAIGGHTSHWDPTMRHGIGCEQCNREREALAVTRAALEGRDG